MTKPYLKERHLFYAACIIFIIAKIPHLSDSFYWDESWVYGPAVQLMHDHGPSLMPDAIPVEFSRGHPLFIIAACASWMYLFGTSYFSMHSCMLFISLGLAISMYEILFRLFNSRVAMLSGLFLLLNINFYVASSYILTDIPITLFVFLSIYCYIKRKYYLTVLFSTMTYFTKESGLLLGIVFVADIAINVIKGKYTRKELAFRCFSVATPLVFIAAFFVIQKQTHGWYLYPYHTSFINLKPENTLINLQKILKIVFYDEQIYLFYSLFIATSIITAYRLKQVIYLWPLLSTLFAYLAILLFSSKDLAFYLFIIYLLICTYIFRAKYARSFRAEQRYFISLVLAFCLSFIYFSCVNFFTERYMFPVIFIVSIVLLSIAFDRLLSKNLDKHYKVILMLTVIIGLLGFRGNSAVLADYERMDMLKHIVKYFAVNNLNNKYIFSNSSLQRSYFTDSNAAELTNGKPFPHVSDKISDSTDFAVFNNIDPEWREVIHLKKDTVFFRTYRYEKGTNWVDVYKKRR